MAAIKRSQANQRRHPESFHLFNQNQQETTSSSLLKVEMKHFVLTILDDPIVSRVFAEAGFRSYDVKLVLLQPPIQPSSLFFPSRTLSPPVFLCNLELGRLGTGPGLGYPLGIDENSRRIVEVLVKKNKMNPLLMGVYAKGALKSFTELVQKGRGGALLPPDMAGLSVIYVDNEILEFVTQGGTEEKMGMRFKELVREVEECSGPGVAVGFGDVEVFLGDSVNDGAVWFVVSQLVTNVISDLDVIEEWVVFDNVSQSVPPTIIDLESGAVHWIGNKGRVSNGGFVGAEFSLLSNH